MSGGQEEPRAVRVEVLGEDVRHAAHALAVAIRKALAGRDGITVPDWWIRDTVNEQLQRQLVDTLIVRVVTR